MAHWAKCIYLPPSGATPSQIAAALQQFHDRLFEQLDGRLDGHNLAGRAFGTGLAFRPSEQIGKPPVLVNMLSPLPPHPTPPAPPDPIPGPLTPGIRLKRVNDTGAAVGLEALVDSADASGDGTFCWVPSKDTFSPKRQLATMALDAHTAASPGATLRTNYGAMTINTAGAFDVIVKRNNVEGLRQDGTGLLTALQFRSTLATGTSPFAVASTTKVDNLNVDRLDGLEGADFQLVAEKNTDGGYAGIATESFTATASGSGTIADATSFVKVNASALAGTDEHTLELPNPAAYESRTLKVKVDANFLGAGTSTVKLSPVGGATIDGAGSYSLDAFGATSIDLTCDGTNWHITGGFGIFA